MTTKKRPAKRPLSRWTLNGIDPDGPLVRRVEEIAAMEGTTVEAWLERWLTTVLHEHYRPAADGAAPDTLIGRAATVRANVQRNLNVLSAQLSRLSSAVEQVHQQVTGVEDQTHSLEEDVGAMEKSISALPTPPGR